MPSIQNCAKKCHKNFSHKIDRPNFGPKIFYPEKIVKGPRDDTKEKTTILYNRMFRKKNCKEISPWEINQIQYKERHRVLFCVIKVILKDLSGCVETWSSIKSWKIVRSPLFQFVIKFGSALIFLKYFDRWKRKIFLLWQNFKFSAYA